MSRTMMLRFATPSLVLILSGLALGACATSDDQGTLPPPKKQPDAAAFLDTSTNETGEDASVSDTAPIDMGSCSPLTSESKPCGKCGAKTRTCSSAGTWNEWSTCSGEKDFVDCSIDEVRANPCGNCGTQKDTCDPMTCSWNSGVCLGEGACAAGETETSTASCSVVGEVRTRTCSDKCAWGGYSDCTLPKGWIAMKGTLPTGFDSRVFTASVWTGTDMIVWGGFGPSTAPTYTYYRGNGASYNLSGDAWKLIASSTSTNLGAGRWMSQAVWTGSKMIVWGGTTYSSSSTTSPFPTVATGASYEPATDSWKNIASPSITGRVGHTAVWSTSTNEMLIWGGASSSGLYEATGAAYDPATDAWTAIPAGPLAGRWKHSSVWTGSELVIWGGQGTTGYLRDGARYDPKTKVWTKFPDPTPEFEGRIDQSGVWSGKELLVWGGYGNYVSPTYGKSDGARYLPGGSWTRFTPPADDVFASGTVATRFGAGAFFGAGKLWVFSGANGTSSTGAALAGMFSYDPSTDKWTTVDTTSAPTARVRSTVVWTGKEAIVWSGASSASSYPSVLLDGAIYRP